MSKSYSDRVMRFRRGVYRHPSLTAGCKVLLLWMSEAMNAKAIVSIPRSRMAEDLGVAPARVSEWVKQAKAAGFLDIVRRGRPGVTAVYQGLVVGTGFVPTTDSDEVPAWYGNAFQVVGTESVPEDRHSPAGESSQGYENHPPQVVETEPSEQQAVGCAYDEAATEAPAGLRLVAGVGWVAQ